MFGMKNQIENELFRHANRDTRATSACDQRPAHQLLPKRPRFTEGGSLLHTCDCPANTNSHPRTATPSLLPRTPRADNSKRYIASCVTCHLSEQPDICS
jgi:hypothetical protein